MVAGKYISPGYWKNDEATQTTFSSDDELGILYFTGDLGRLLPNGQVEFMGRRDSQVKLRGFRIELGEIESRLLTHPRVSEAVILAREVAAPTESPGDAAEANRQAGREKFLCAYYVEAPGEEGKVEISQLRNFLAGELPDYMVPTYFVPMESFPLTQSGKIDRKALPEPVAAEENYIAPRNEVEEKLVELWAAVLNEEPEQLGIDADFFRMGGHSLKATALVSRIHRALDVKVPVGQLFKTSTIRGLAEYIQSSSGSKMADIPLAPKKSCYPLPSLQERLYILSRMEGIETAFNIRNALRVQGRPSRERLEESFRTLIRRHESLRTSFEVREEGPVQVIHNTVDFNIEYHNVESTDVNQESVPAVDEIIQRFIRPFDLSRAPLLRVGLLSLSADDHVLIMDMHHIVSDGTSMTIFFRGVHGALRRKNPAAT